MVLMSSQCSSILQYSSYLRKQRCSKPLARAQPKTAHSASATARIMNGKYNEDEDEHRQAFGEHIPMLMRERINRIRNNDPELRKFTLHLQLQSGEWGYLSELAWQLLGRYIAANDHLMSLYLTRVHFAGDNMSNLFKNLTISRSLTELRLGNNDFGLEDMQSMVLFLENSPSLKRLEIGNNIDMNTECFGLLIGSLNGGNIEYLHLWDCRIDDISELDNHSLAHLKILNLNNNKLRIIPSLDKYTNLEELRLNENKIGKEGCRLIAELLQNNRSRLRHLGLESNDMGDNEVEILANSLKNNTTLKELLLRNNILREIGLRAFVKLLNDVTSIGKTYDSNHTLTKVLLSPDSDSKSTEIVNHIEAFIQINIVSGQAGREKVIATQLNSNTRMELCNLQGIGYSYSGLFVGIEPILLPDILAIIGGRHAQSELYRMLIATVPDLESIVNKKAFAIERGLLKIP